jgi:predicted DNA-binding transcriptional regulator AlpA
MLKNENSRSSMSNDKLLNKQELRDRLGLQSTRGIDELIRRKKLPVIRLGYRTVRFSLPQVMLALERLTVKEVQ